jgi:hypothetical protein
VTIAPLQVEGDEAQQRWNEADARRAMRLKDR